MADDPSMPSLVLGYVVSLNSHGIDQSRQEIRRKGLTFGRSIECDYRIHLPTVSKRHCAIIIDKDDTWWLENKSAQNPPCVLGNPVFNRCQIGHNTVLFIGAAPFRIIQCNAVDAPTLSPILTMFERFLAFQCDPKLKTGISTLLRREQPDGCTSDDPASLPQFLARMYCLMGGKKIIADPSLFEATSNKQTLQSDLSSVRQDLLHDRAVAPLENFLGMVLLQSTAPVVDCELDNSVALCPVAPFSVSLTDVSATAAITATASPTTVSPRTVFPADVPSDTQCATGRLKMNVPNTTSLVPQLDLAAVPAELVNISPAELPNVQKSLCPELIGQMCDVGEALPSPNGSPASMSEQSVNVSNDIKVAEVDASLVSAALNMQDECTDFLVKQLPDSIKDSQLTHELSAYSKPALGKENSSLTDNGKPVRASISSKKNKKAVVKSNMLHSPPTVRRSTRRNLK